ncbi:MAG: hypothetical protein H8E18_07935 [FCB group bacterium]|nr:hypothetical protein [FCB group bacterium]
MSSCFPWEANPARKYFDIILAEYWGYPLAMHETYEYRSFGQKERAHLRTEIEKLPRSPLRELLLTILEVLQAPVGSFKIKSFKLKDDRDKIIHTHEIMMDAHVFFRVAGLSWLNVSSVEIFTNLSKHSIKMIYKEKHIARFLNQYWNVGTQLGYSGKCRDALRDHIRARPRLRRLFKPLVKGVLSHEDPFDLVRIYDIQLTHKQLRALNNQTIQNGRLALFVDSKGIKSTEAEHISTKFLETTLKMQTGLIDHDERQGNGSDPDDLLSLGGLGDDYE